MNDFDTSPINVVRPILVVDDLPANLVAVEAVLEPLERPIVTASSGNDALARLLEQDFSVVLLDVQMPGMDGYETARWIRSRERSQHVPIIFLTAHDHDQKSQLRAYELGAVDFMHKPIVPEVLRARVSVFVTLQERTEQLAAERVAREFDERRRDFETSALRRERDRELVAKRELARLNEALAASDRRKDSFIAILAHELRNPLAPVRACVDLMRSESAAAFTPRMLDIIDRQTAALSRLVDDLLDLSRIKADKIELRPERVDIADVIENTIATSQHAVARRGHALTFERRDPVHVVVDPVRIGQVIGNLLNNAIRYTPPGGHIEIGYGAAGAEARVRVIDSGIGVPPELQETIFGMFVQERVVSDGSGGLGLGLALARRLVEMHRGAIFVESAGRGRGSCFEVRLPLATSELAMAPRSRTRDLEPPKPTRIAGTIRTIVIDDNDDARELVSEMLRRRGYEVMTANDGSEGLQLLRTHQPHVALVDLGLPGLDGIGVAEALRTECPTHTTRMIALTGYADQVVRERTTRAGFHAHLVKPATADAIVDCISRQLEQ